MMNNKAIREINRGDLHNPAHAGLSYIEIVYADRVYQKIRNQDQKVLEQNLKALSPVGFWDSLAFVFNSERKGNLAAVKRVLQGA